MRAKKRKCAELPPITLTKKWHMRFSEQSIDSVKHHEVMVNCNLALKSQELLGVEVATAFKSCCLDSSMILHAFQHRPPLAL